MLSSIGVLTGSTNRVVMVTVPQAFQMECYLRSMHPDVCDGAARRNDFFAQLERGRDAHRFNSGISTAIFMMVSTALPSALLMPAVAPNRFAISRRLSSTSIMMISDGE
jgi:hypothetical protein